MFSQVVVFRLAMLLKLLKDLSLRQWMALMSLAEKRNDFKVLNDAVTNLKRIMRDEGLDELVADF